jgi:hypothetical protein
MPQTADRTLAAIRVNYDVPKGALVEALAGKSPRIAAQVQGGKGDLFWIRSRLQICICRVHGGSDKQRLRVVLQDHDRPDGLEVMGMDLSKIDKGSSSPTGLTEATVVTVVLIISAVGVRQNPIFIVDVIVVRAA